MRWWEFFMTTEGEGAEMKVSISLGLLLVMLVMVSSPAKASALQSKTIKLDGCSFTITDYARWSDFKGLAKLMESGDPEVNRLRPLCRKLPGGVFTVNSHDMNEDPFKQFTASVNGCDFQVVTQEKRGNYVVAEKGMDKCLRPYRVINTDTSKGYTIWALECRSGRSAWVNDQNKHFYEYGGARMGRAKTQEEAMAQACQ